MATNDGSGSSIKRVHLPVDFDGPICAKCIHVKTARPLPNCPNGHNWRCHAGDRVIEIPAHTDPLTGKVRHARYASWPRCEDRNERGDCKDFQRNCVPDRRGHRG